jgi:hypothetical protein
VASGALGCEAVHSAGFPGPARTIPVLTFGMSLSSFLVTSYTLCVPGYLLFPSLPINHVWR